MTRLNSFIFFLLFSIPLLASHGMGGEITYRCVGGNAFVFELVFYRDCNGAEINIVSENLQVWNHPTISIINMPFVSRQDISPICTGISGYSSPLLCGVGSAGGNGVGAIEKVIYRSAPILLTGVPPVQGWIFTFKNFSRSSSLTNIVNPANYGITLTAKMFAIPNNSGTGCYDSSPVFLQAPNLVSCVGTPYVYNMNAVDPDLDSVHFEFGIPYDTITSGIYDPPNNPIPVPYEQGFSYQNPTPTQPGSLPAIINPLNGELNFTSNIIGNYVVKIIVKSFRQGVLISEVEREMQIVILPCSFQNDPPIFYEPYTSLPMPSGGWEVTVPVGEYVVIPITTIPNPEMLQDGSLQTNYLSASSPMFGTNFSLDTGCGNEPCAQLNPPPIVSNNMSVNTTLLWQTDCNHLVGADGNALDTATYVFVFKAQDDVCPVPKINYATFTIKLVNTGVISATQITCLETLSNGDVKINWNQVANPNNSFVAYKLKSLQGLNLTISDINTTSYTIPAINAAHDFYIGVQSGCNGNVTKYSDTVSNIHLDLINPDNGTAILQWNKPKSTPLNSYNSHYRIYREYPVGTFTLIDSTLYSITNYKDTIDICNAFLSYKIILPTSFCEFSSNKPGDDFEDMLTPAIPVILSAGIDTNNNNILLTWNQNSQPDTYGYVIYTFDTNGFLYELDTVWGITNTTYSYNENLSNGPFSYSVAAFDSCSTASIPVTFQTSAKGLVNTTMICTSEIFMCEREAKVSWSKYGGQVPLQYNVWSKSNGTWTISGSTSDTTIIISINQGQSYCVYIEAVFASGYSAFSCPTCFVVPTPGIPAYHYFKLATVNNQKVELYDYIDSSVGISKILFERKQLNGSFEQIGFSNVDSDVVLFVDENVNLEFNPWEYRTKYVDSCGDLGNYANNNKTIYVNGTTDEYNMINNIQWTPYFGFDGEIIEYLIYRGIDGNFDSNPIVQLPNTSFNYVDDVSAFRTNGSICYRVEAREALNVYNFSEISRSNDFCINYTPLIFVPNAFTPGGINPIFIPVLSNVSTENYEFTIMNRWGQVIFKTNDNNQGWNGEVLNTGEMATSDTFLYVITFEDQNKRSVTKKGFVAMLK